MNRITMGITRFGMSPDYRAIVACTRSMANVDKFSRRNCSTVSSRNPQGLPSLPVVPLKETIEKYLKTVEPHLSAAEFTKTIKVAREFEAGKGRKLQELLEERAKQHDSWLADWWLDGAYLTYRDPVVVYSSPGLIFPEQKFRNEVDRLTYAVKVVFASLNYKAAVDGNQIPVEKVGKAELDMQQYHKIFGTCRVPQPGKDALMYNPQSDYIIVMHKGNYYKVPVYGGADGRTILSERELFDQLNACVSTKRNGSPIGILSSDNRDNWAEAYQELVKDPLNRTSVEVIQKSLFVLSLDDLVPENDSYYNMSCHQLITGGGAQFNTGNRWYDKTVQFIVGERGINGLTYEHSPAEGQPIAVLTDYILGYIQKSARLSDAQEVGQKQQPCELKFNVTAQVQDLIDSAANNINSLASNLDMYTLEFAEYGKSFIKSQKMSPDSFLQIAMQYAFYRLHGVPAAQYETGQTRMFIHGRTETIRTCSNESLDFAKAMMGTVSDKEKVQKLRTAVDAHKRYTVMAMNGRGVDRHFFGFKMLAGQHGIDVSEFFSDPGYVKSATMRMSTSQVASRYPAVMCYGPLVENGYGCCYNPLDDQMLFAISSMEACKETSAKRFGAAMKDSLMNMYTLLRDAPQQSKL